MEAYNSRLRRRVHRCEKVITKKNCNNCKKIPYNPTERDFITQKIMICFFFWVFLLVPHFGNIIIAAQSLVLFAALVVATLQFFTFIFDFPLNALFLDFLPFMIFFNHIVFVFVLRFISSTFFHNCPVLIAIFP